MSLSFFAITSNKVYQRVFQLFTLRRYTIREQKKKRSVGQVSVKIKKKTSSKKFFLYPFSSEFFFHIVHSVLIITACLFMYAYIFKSLKKKKNLSIHSKKFLGRREENAEVRSGKMQFYCFRPTFGPIWTNFCLKQVKFVHTGHIGLNVDLKHVKFIQIGPKVGLK